VNLKKLKNENFLLIMKLKALRCMDNLFYFLEVIIKHIYTIIKDLNYICKSNLEFLILNYVFNLFLKLILILILFISLN